MAGVDEAIVPEVAVVATEYPMAMPSAPVPAGTPVAAGGPPRALRAAARRRQTIIRTVVLVVVGVLMLLPLLGLLDFSTRFPNGRRTGRSWGTLLHLSQLDDAAPGLLSGFWTTMALCVTTALLTVLLLVPTMTWVRLRLPQVAKLVEFLCLLPLTIPAIVLVAGLGGIYREIGKLLSTGSIWLTFAYVILALPYAYRAIATGLAAIDVKTLAEAARSLGCSWGRVMFRVILPNMVSAVIGACFLTIALVLGEYTVAYLLSRNNLSVALFNLGLNASGDPRLTAAVSLVLLVFGLVLMFVFSFVGNSRNSQRNSR